MELRATRVRVDFKHLLERVERALLVSALEKDQPHARDGAEVTRLQRESALYVPNRVLEAIHQVVHGRPLVPRLRERGCGKNQIGEAPGGITEPVSRAWPRFPAP